MITAVLLSASEAVRADEEAITPEKTELGRPVDFAKDIAPIFRANCVACHNKAKSEGQLILEDTAAIMKGGSSGDVIVPGKPDESYLYQVAARIEESYMPPMPNEVQAKKLTPREVGLLRQWIIEGAKAGSSSSAANMNWQAINTGLNAIYAVDTDPYGRFIAAGRAGNVHIYDLKAPEQVITVKDPALKDGSPQQQTHRDYVHAVAFHPDGQMVATSGFQVVKLWKRTVDAPGPAIAAPGDSSTVVLNHAGTLAAGQGSDGVIRVTDLAGKKVVNEVAGYAPDKSTLLGILGPDDKWLLTGSGDGSVNLVNRSDAAVVGSSEPLGAPAAGAAYIDAGSRIVVVLEDGTLRSLTLNEAEKKLTAAEPVKSDKGAIRQIAIAGAVLMCRVEGNVIELRKADSLKPGVTIQSSTPNISAAISPNAERVVSVSPDGVAELWNAKDGKIVATLKADLLATRTLVQRTADKAVRDARVTVVKGQITEDEKRVTEQKDSLKKAEEEVKKATEGVAAAKKKLDEETPKVAAAKKASDEKPDDAGLKKKLEDAQKAEQTAKDGVTTAENTLKSANKSVELSKQAIARAEAKVADRKTLLTAVEAEAKAAADAHTAADAEAKKSVASAFAGFAGDAFVVTVDQPDADGNASVRLWATGDGAAVDHFPSAAGKTTVLASRTADLLVRSDTGDVLTLGLFPEWKLTQTLGPQGQDKPSAFVDRVLALAFSPDGGTLAAGGGEASRSGELTLWNVADGKLIRRFEDAHSDTVYGLDFSRDGKLIASAAADKFVKVFDLASGKHVRSYEGHTHHVMDVSWKGDGTRLVSAGADNAIKVWNAETGEQTRTISTYKKQVTALEFIGMEDDFISCSGDKRVFRLKASNGGTVREFKGCPDYVYCSAITADGTVVAAGCEDGILRIWNGKDGKEIASFTP